METGNANSSAAVYGFRNSRIYVQTRSPSKATSIGDCVSCFVKAYKCIYLVFRYKLCPQEVTLDNSTNGRNRIVLPVTALLVRLVYEIRLPHAISTKFPPRKMELFIQIGGLQWWKPMKNTSGETFR